TNFYSGAADISDAATQAQADAGNVAMNGVLIWKNNLGTANAPSTLEGQITSTYTQAFASGQRGTVGGQPAGRNFVVADPLLTDIGSYSNLDFTGLFGSPIGRPGWV